MKQVEFISLFSIEFFLPQLDQNMDLATTASLGVAASLLLDGQTTTFCDLKFLLIS